MNMVFKRETNLLIKMMVYLAKLKPGTMVKLRDITAAIGESWRMSTVFVHRLRNYGLLDADRGHGGGIMLAKPANEISLYDIIEAAEGGIIGYNHLDLDNEIGRLLDDYLDSGAEYLKKKFKKVKLTDLNLEVNPIPISVVNYE